MEALRAKLVKLGGLVRQYRDAMLVWTQAVSEALQTDPSIRSALDPNNEYASFEEIPLAWEELEGMGHRQNFFKRKFRFEARWVEVGNDDGSIGRPAGDR